MAKLILSNLANLENQTSACATINANKDATVAAMENTLSRDGTDPNQMNSVLDMNSNQIINLPAPTSVNSPARLSDVTYTTSSSTLSTGTAGHVVPYLDAANTWSLSQNFLSPIKINGNIILSHPLTPTPDNVAGSIITLGLGAGGSLAPIHSTQYLTLLGYSAGGAITTADHITACGAFTLAAYTTGPTPAGLTAIGVDSQRALTTGSQNTTLGEHTFTQATTFTGVTGVGYGAGFNCGGDYNSFFGWGSGGCVAGMNGTYNLGLGIGSLNGLSGAASGNIGVGAFAGAGISTGGNNIVIGRLAGQTLTTGNANILIGTSAEPPTASTGSYLNIGGWLFGDAANHIRVKGAVGTKPPGVLSGASGTVGADDSNIIVNSSGAYTITLPNPVTYPGRWLLVRTVSAFTVSSASANVVPITGLAAGTAILTAVVGKWAWLQSDGANWGIMAAN